MDLWFSEKPTNNVKFSIRVDKQLYSGQSEFQRIDVFESPEFGKFLTLDGYMMFTEKDEFIYHEMITHIPMAVHPHVENILVIGAGDGGVVRELTRYEEIKRIDLVEIDEMVVEVCKEYFPHTACGLEDERVHIFYEDGLKFIRRCKEEYDLIIVDSTDPFGPGEGLFTKEFYGNCSKALTDQGILINQHESTYYDSYVDMVKRTHRRIGSAFPVSMVYQTHIPTYPSGHWLFGFASKNLHPIYDLKADEWKKFGIKTRYYNTELHKGCFALPNYVLDVLEDCD